MLQRIQSIWLLLASVCAFLGLKMSFYSGTTADGIPSHKLIGIENLALMIPTIAIGILSLICIFLYSNRKLQLRLCLLGIILEVCLIIIYYKMVSNYSEGAYSLSAALQAFVLLFLGLAARGIRSDEKIVRESNRLR